MAQSLDHIQIEERLWERFVAVAKRAKKDPARLLAELLRDYLAASGIPCELVGRSPDRLNLIARLKGGGGPTLALLAHTDTVRADPEEWSRDPWSGDLVDGEVWDYNEPGRFAAVPHSVLEHPCRFTASDGRVGYGCFELCIGEYEPFGLGPMS